MIRSALAALRPLLLRGLRLLLVLLRGAAKVLLGLLRALLPLLLPALRGLLRGLLRILRGPVGRVLLVGALALLLLGWLGGSRTLPPTQMAPAVDGSVADRPDLARLRRALAAARPYGVYVTVDAVANRLQVRRGDEVLLDALCSAGTGSVLEDPRTGRRWVFDTPRGARTVLEKKKDPVWTKPEWAFIEEGEDLPRNWADRLDDASLGDYALYLGDGYMIHGTLYQRYLGRNVTHGCIRLGDKDLEFVYKKVPVGASVFLF